MKAQIPLETAPLSFQGDNYVSERIRYDQQEDNGAIGARSTSTMETELERPVQLYETLTVREDISTYLKTGTRFTMPSQVYETFSFLMKETKEMFLTLHVDGKNKIICMDLVSIGSLNQSIVHPREVFKTALLSNAAAIICVHQHPSGCCDPSSEDISITRRLKEAGEIIGIRILDHIIIGQGEYLSFVERGLL